MDEEQDNRPRWVLQAGPDGTVRMEELETARDEFDQAFNAYGRERTPEAGRERLRAAVHLVRLVRPAAAQVENAALGVVLRAIEDAIVGNVWPELSAPKPGSPPLSHAEKDAIREGQSFIAHAQFGLIDHTKSEAIAIVAEKYGRSKGAVRGWYREVKNPAQLLRPSLTEGPDAKRRKTERLKRLLDYYANSMPPKKAQLNGRV